MIPHGLYEEILSELRRRQLVDAAHAVQPQVRPLDPGDSPVALAEYVRKLIAAVLDGISGEDRLERQVELCNRVVTLLHESDPALLEPALAVAREAEQLLGVTAAEPTPVGQPTSLERPDTPLALGCLLTGTRLDPALASQLKKEIRTADRIEILCSFIKWSGLRILLDDLASFTARPGTSLRVITTSYTGATELKAIEHLDALPRAEVRISYDTHRTRLHAKAYTFHRATGFGSAYIGSANLSHAAMTDGLEWTVKISQYETPHLWQKVTATFETYWNDAEFVTFTADDRPRLAEALRRERAGQHNEDNPFVFDLRPHSFQLEILEKIDAEREVQGRQRHLVVAATGTGKTMIAAFDYRRWCDRQIGAGTASRPRLLFVAHREEILRQSRAAFRGVLRDQNFGDLLVGGNQPTQYDHLFVSIQSYNSRGLRQLAPDHFQYVVVDEFHHAAAASYEDLLDHVQPAVLLGLTATPERADGLDVLRHFGGHMSAEIRLPDAINRKLLCPFQYFAVSDSVDLSEVRWRRGGYDLTALDAKYTGNDIRTQLILDQCARRLLDPRQARGLGFCVSIAHANYMAEQFRRAGIPAEALSADSPNAERRTVQDRLRSRQINFIFVVDLYNEGVDIPDVDTVLFLRPTESLTVFLQQLGRGLRQHPDKDCLTVLDFVGQAHRAFRWDLRLRALLADPAVPLVEHIEHGFTYLPAGCTIDLERQARQYILDNVHRAVTQSRRTLVGEVRALAEILNRPPQLREFLDYFKLETEAVYGRNISWSRLLAEAGLQDAVIDPDAQTLTAGLRRIQHIDSGPQIRQLLAELDPQHPAALPTNSPELRERLLTMLHLSLWRNNDCPATVAEANERLRRNPTMLTELVTLLALRLDAIASVPPPLDLPFTCPLTLHAQYTRDEILASLGHYTLQDRPQMREGVLHLAEIRADAFFITLNKTERHYSPTTMYRDYAINERLFHWQSQSTTSVASPTGQRYIHHAERGYTMLLFVREERRINGLAAPYSFVGPADYQSHEGSRPISIVWRLRHAMPARLLSRMARLTVA